MKSKWYRERDEAIVKDYSNGMSVETLARKYMLAESTIHEILKEGGVTITKKYHYSKRHEWYYPKVKETSFEERQRRLLQNSNTLVRLLKSINLDSPALDQKWRDQAKQAIQEHFDIVSGIGS